MPQQSSVYCLFMGRFVYCLLFCASVCMAGQNLLKKEGVVRLCFLFFCIILFFTSYRGCGGNGNNFKTENECNIKCSTGSPPINFHGLENKKKCDSEYGCCSDNVNGARGPNFIGCPSKFFLMDSKFSKAISNNHF